MRYAIVGFGCGGYQAAKEIRCLDPDGEICVFNEHSEAPYNPMLTTYYVSGKLKREGAFPFGDLDRIQRELKLKIESETCVKHINGKKRSIILEDGREEIFDRILIATGARAWAPHIEGLDPEKAFFMRTMEDADQLKKRIEVSAPKKAIVVGASMVGIKVVELLRARGAKVLLADLAPRIFPLAAYEQVSHEIEKRVKDQGVSLAFGCSIASVEERGTIFGCTLTDGQHYDADLIVLCIGTRANTGVVDPKEIQVDRGILVNEQMETSCAGIYAAGDCCQGREMQTGKQQIIGLWANAGHQGGTAGHNMAKGTGNYDGNILHNITHFMGMDFIGLGDCRREGKVLTFGNLDSGELYIQAVIDQGNLAGVNILDNYRISGLVKNYFYELLTYGKRTGPISSLQRGLLVKEGIHPSFLRKLEAELNVDEVEEKKERRSQNE